MKMMIQTCLKNFCHHSLYNMMIREQVVFSPEVSCASVVVIVDVGDDCGEPDDAGFLRVLVGSSGHAEGCFLLDSNNPVATETT